MHGTNPYAQAGWYNPANPNSINERQGPSISTHPPTYGALPYPDKSGTLTKRFTFTSQRQNLITNCDVIDSDTRVPAYRIRLANDGYDYSSVQRTNGSAIGYIVWKPQGPEVEVYRTVEKQPAAAWLPLSPDHSSRLMQIHGKHYTWQFARDAMYLYAFTLNRNEQIGKVYPTSDGTTIFEASETIISNGLLDSVILAAALLLSEKFRG